MSNIAFDLEVFKQVSAVVPPPGDGKTAALGSIGPDLYQYAPVSSTLSDKLHEQVKKAIESLTPAQIQAGTIPIPDFSPILADSTLGPELLLKPLMAAYSILFRELVVPFWPIFERDVDLLNQLQTAANNQDSNTVKALAGSVNQLTSDAAELQKIVGISLGVTGAISVLAAIPPAIEFPKLADKPWLPQENRPFEFLRWHLTNRFAQKLIQSAATNDQKAYAYGHLCHIAASVTGKPFINNIVGGPYRTHWWRNRLVSNFVDAWTLGRFETPGGASMSGDTPTPPYSGWADISRTNLQDQFNVAGLTAPAAQLPDAVTAVATGQLGSLPGQFPSALADYIESAIEAAYPAAVRPPGFASELAKESFVGLFAVVWFMTSGFGPMTPIDLGPAPSTCTTTPSWVTSHGSPPSPQQSGPSTGATVCGVLLAILALILFVFENWAGGAAAVVGAINQFTSGGGIDWDQLACNIFWMRSGLQQGQAGLVDALVRSGLAYPPPAKIADPASLALFKSIPAGSMWAPAMPYPLQMDNSVGGHPDLNFGNFPTSAAETPQTVSFPPQPCYADTVVNGSPMPAGGGMLTGGGTFPTANVFFGDAVSNAKAVIADQAKTLPSYNLDADRGYGWLTWGPQPQTLPASGQINNPIKE